MNRKGRSVLFITGGITGLIVVFLVIRFIVNYPVTSQIPEISDSSNLSAPVKEQITEAFRETKRNPSEANLGMLGMIFHASAFYSEAGKCYQLAADKSKSDWKWNYYNGYLNIELGNPEKAIEYFRIVTDKNPDIDLAWYYTGEAYKNIRNNDQAIKSFEKITSGTKSLVAGKAITRQDHFPIKTYADFERARICFDTGNTELAEKILKELIQKSPLFGASYKLLGNIYNMRGDTVSGYKYTVRANDLINFSPPVDTLIDKLALLSRSELYLLKKIDEAEYSFYSDWALGLVNQGMQFFPDNSYLISKAIKIYLWKKLNDKAIGLIDKHLSLISDNYQEIKNTGIIFFQNGLYKQAARYWTKALELKPDEILLKEYLAKSLLETGEKQESVKLLDDLVAKNPENTEVLAEVTEIMFDYGLKEKAAVYLEKLKQAAPFNPKLQRISGEIAFSDKDFQNALIYYENSFKSDPKDAKTIQGLSEIYKLKQMWIKYISLYRKALIYTPNSPDFLYNLGVMLISCPDAAQRNIEEGKDYMERAFTYYNCPPDILIPAGSNLAYAYSLLGERQKAIITVSQTINIAKRQKISREQMAKLEQMLIILRNTENR